MKTGIRGKVEKTAGSRQEPAKKRTTALRHSEKGKIGWILLWLLGIPIPILVVLYFLRGCT